MKIIQPIRYFFSHYMTFLDRVFIVLTLLSFIFGATLFFLNTADFHYKITALFAPSLTTLSWFDMVSLVLLCLVFLFYGMYIRNLSPRSSTFIWGTGIFFWSMIAGIAITNAIQVTPFAPIDPLLVKIDSAMGINTAALMAWTHQHPHIHKLFNATYFGLIIELITIPLILIMIGARKSVSVFYIAQMITLLAGSAIYFFFPTMAPSGIIHSPYFSHMQDDTSMRFYQLHHFLKPTSDDGGLIAFPSFHVIWAVLLTYACRAQKIFFYPVAIYNSILIVATVFLGWHYVTDVIAGVILAVLGIMFGNWVYKKSFNDF
jgi:membrane-associated phospholipid phosphatase